MDEDAARFTLVCDWCGGSGHDPADCEPRPCVRCGGRGLLDPDEFWPPEDDDDDGNPR